MASKRNNLLAELAARGRFVSAEDAQAVGRELGLTPAAVRVALTALRNEGWLTSLRRGLDLVTTPGSSPVHPFVLGTALTADATIAGWAALHHHGFTEQLPRTTEVMTTQKTRTHRGEEHDVILFEGERFELVTVVKSRMFGIEEVWLDNARARILERERALLELFVRPRDFGGLETALDALEEHGHEIDVAKLADHARSLGTSSVAKRVGWALENTLAASERILDPLRAMKTTGYALLDPSKPARGARRSRWHLRENL